MRTRRPGIISLFASVARKLRVESEPCYCCHVCVCGQAVVFPSSWALVSMCILLHVVCELPSSWWDFWVAPRLSFHDFFTQKATLCSCFTEFCLDSSANEGWRLRCLLTGSGVEFPAQAVPHLLGNLRHITCSLS